MSKERSDKDVVIVAMPDQHKAVIAECNSADVLSIVQNLLGSALTTDVPEDKVNELLEKIREQKLSYSFKLAA